MEKVKVANRQIAEFLSVFAASDSLHLKNAVKFKSSEFFHHQIAR
jgi:hypothetical protein